MTNNRRGGVRAVWTAAWTVLAGMAAVLPPDAAVPLGVASGQTRMAEGSARVQADEWSRAVWTAASANGDRGRLETLLSNPPSLQPLGLGDSIATLEANMARRETRRIEEIEEAGRRLDEQLERAGRVGIARDLALSDALVTTVRLHLLSTNKSAFLAEERTRRVIALASEAAREAEGRGDWLMANELFVRLNALLEQERTFRADADRLARRLDILRLFVPERLWELRNERELAEGRPALPAYNPFGDDYTVKLQGIQESSVVTALRRSVAEHVERERSANFSLELALGGLDGVATLASTRDIGRVFSGVNDTGKLARFLDHVESARRSLSGRSARVDFAQIMGRLLDASDATIGLPHAAILHEFGNGAVSRLDEFTQIIWPDELAQFQKQTQGRFIGIGVQIQLDERSNIVVVTPLEGTPAQREDVRAGDIIKAVDGRSIVGFGLNQAVSVITGEPGSAVRLTLEREVEGERVEVERLVPRAQIAIGSVKGWERTGARDDAWNWFIDRQAGIGYVRLTGFVDTTDREFDRAIQEMRAQGLNGLIVDLRYNPGGLLNQAVAIANRFIPVRAGAIVRTADAQNRVASEERANARLANVTGIPIIVLINEGAASASEIVAGAVQSYAQSGTIDALVLGQRSFGKGSVQNVYFLPGNRSAMRLTTHYYLLPNGRRVHRLPGDTDWGVKPDLQIEMLPSQIEQAVNLRRDADVLAINQRGEVVDTGRPRPDPNDLLSQGIDLQLQYALVLLQSRSSAPALGQVPRPPMPVTIEN